MIETSYIDGVYDDSGKEVLRPLTDSEKKWLNQFYSETVNADYFSNPKVKELSKLRDSYIMDAEIEEVVAKSKEESCLKKRRNLQKVAIKLKKKNMLKNKEELDKVLQELEEVKNLVFLTYNKKSEIYKENKARNEDLYNRLNSRNQLLSFGHEDYDLFTSKKIQGMDMEHVIIDFNDEEDFTNKLSKDKKKKLKKIN